jgi:hypothetical protein
MMDDHEIVDNFGSDPIHGSPDWAPLRKAALEAFGVYQGFRNPGPDGEARFQPPFDFGFRWGKTATYVLDIRSERVVHDTDHGEILSESQFQRLERFLVENRDCHSLFIVSTVPPVFLPDWLVNAATRALPGNSDVADRWNAPMFSANLERFIDILDTHRRDNPQTRLAVLSGDIHQGSAYAVGQENEGFYQFVSSPLTNTNDAIMQWAAEKAGSLTGSTSAGSRKLDCRRLEGQEDQNHNPYPDLNVGIVDVDASGSLRFRLFGLPDANTDDDTSQGLIPVFDSGAL